MTSKNLERLAWATVSAYNRRREALDKFDLFSHHLLQEMEKMGSKRMEWGLYTITMVPIATVECQGCKRPLDPPAGLPKEQPGRKLVIKKRRQGPPKENE